MKKLLSILLSLTLLLALTTPALAWEYPGTKYDSVEAYLEFYSSCDDADTRALADYIQNYLAEHPDFLETFDADAYFEANLANPGMGVTKANWFAWQFSSYTEEHFRAEMLNDHLTQAYRAWRDAGPASALAAPEEEAESPAVYELCPEVEEWIRSHPQATREFHAQIDAYAAREWGYASLAEMAAAWEESEAFVRNMLTEEWVLARMAQEEMDAWAAQYEAANPGAVAALEGSAYSYFAEHYIWYDSPEEYMENWGMTEEEFLRSMVAEQLQELRDREETRLAREQAKLDLGGVPGQMGVMLNGQYIPFTDALPEAVDGRIMVPYRALMEALGGEVDYDSATQTVSCILGDTTLALKLGESTINVREGDVSSVLVMDCAAYAREGRTYVPVRFISQAFGCDVLWDHGFETVVLLDREALIAEIDSRFTVLNRVLAGLRSDPEQPWETTGELDATLTLFDSIAGDETYSFSADLRSRGQFADSQGEIAMDLSFLTGLLDLEYLLAGDPYSGLTEEEQALAGALIASLTDLSLEYIIDSASGAFYVRSPLLNLAGGYPQDAWLAEYTGQPFSMGEVPTVGRLIYDSSLSGIDTEYDPEWTYLFAPVFAWSSLMDAAAQADSLLGDGRFTAADQGDVLLLDPAALGLDLEDSYSPFSDLVFTFTVADSGAVDGSLRMVLSERGLDDLLGSSGAAAVLEGVFSLDAAHCFLLMDLHVKNLCRLELKMTADVTPADAAPLTAPPEGDIVIDNTEF